MVDPAGSDTGAEWIELYNPLDSPVELRGLTAFTHDTGGSNHRTHAFRTGVVGPHEYFVVGDVRGKANPAWVDASYGDDLGSFDNGHGAVGLRCGATVLDEVAYTRPASSARSRMLAGDILPDASSHDDETHWCDTPVGIVYAAPNAGTPGAANPACALEAAAGTCVEEGAVRRIVAPRPGELFITEVMANPKVAQSSAGEWFEIQARASVDLNELTVVNASGTRSTVRSQGCLRVQEGAYAILARSEDDFVNGSLPSPTATYGVALTDGNERLILRHGDDTIDEVRFGPSADGVAWQFDPARFDGGASANDLEDGFCKAPRPWKHGTDFGSPGVGNPPCGGEPPRDGDGGARSGGGGGGGSLAEGGGGHNTGGGAAGEAGDSGVDGGGVDGGGGAATCLDLSGAPRTVIVPKVGDVVITEWMADPASPIQDPQGEYVELRANAAFDLNNLSLTDAANNRSTIDAPDCLAVQAGTYVVLARSKTEGGVPTVDATFDFDLNQGGDTIGVWAADVLLDAVTYGGGAASVKTGVARQLRPALTSPADNDVSANLCFAPATVAFTYEASGANHGTPGAANVCP